LDRIHHVRLMASYDASMTVRINQAARQLSAAALGADRKAFSGSILATLNHLVNGDTIWLKRIVVSASSMSELLQMSE
jgi:uncharacterized damage-inducible protein DinB